jgi:mannosyltransferase OCH1-like enzyme
MDTIHQIWIGDNPLPTPWTDTVKDFARTYHYTYKLWTDSSVDDLGMDEIPGLKALYQSFGKELAGRADILRLLILYKYGGIYIDADTVIMKPEKFDRFLKKQKQKHGMFFGWENLTATRTRKLGLGVRRLVANGIIGAEKGHPFLKRLLDGIVDHSANVTDTKDAWKHVGPYYVTKMYMSLKKIFPDVHVFPMRYFYPRPWAGITDPELHKKVKIPGASMLFQYGYTTNKFDAIFKKRKQSQSQTRRVGRR